MLKKMVMVLYKFMVSGAEYRIDCYLRMLNFSKKNSHPRVASYLANRMQKKYGVFISPKASFDITLKLRHPVAIVVGEGVKLGQNVIVYQNVTLGGARLGDGKASNYPEVGDNTVIFAGAVIVGKVKIGANCTIGANSVVTKDIPDNSVAVGAPARIIQKK